MMLNIVNARTLQISTSNCLAKIKELKNTGKCIVICPDRMALQVEEQIFDTLQVSSLFDVDVYTLSRLSNKVLDSIGNNKKILSKQLAITLIKKIVLENNLNSFKDVVHFKGFSVKIFEILSMFKSSMITPKMLLENTNNVVLKEKLEDLNVIYTKYEEFLSEEYTDSFNRLNLFCSSVTNQFKDVHIIFVGFDDFTKQMLNIVNMFITHAKSVTIGTASSYGFKDLNNKNIYVNNIFYSLIELCKSNGYIYKLDIVEDSYNKLDASLLNNLFAYSPSEYKEDVNSIKLINFNNSSSELDFILKDIKYKVIKQGLKYGNFSVAIPNLNSKYLEIKNKFNEFNIPYFADTSTALVDTNLVRYVLSLYEVILNNYKSTDFLNVLKDAYSNINILEISAFEDYLNLRGIQNIKDIDVKDFENISLIYNNIKELQVDKTTTISVMMQNLHSVIDKLNILEQTNKIINNLTVNNNISLAKDYKLSYEKLLKSLAELEQLFPNYALNIENFINILKVYLENVSVTIPPIIDDVVMVYDINSSFIEQNEYMYILSCVEGLVPQITNDVSLILDKEINYFEENLRLGPTCDVVNKRSKFKVFENMFKHSKQLTISYYKAGFSGSAIESSLVTSIKRCLPNIVEINGDNYITDYDSFNSNTKKDVFILNNICESSAVINLINLTKNFEVNFGKNYFNKYYFSLVDALPNKDVVKRVLSYHNFNNNVQKLEDTSSYFKYGKASVSQIETYYNCPFKHFVRYGLKLTEKKSGNLQPNDIGNIVHEFSSVIISKLIGELTKENIKKLTKEILTEILNNNYNVYVQNKANKHIIKNLHEECNRIAEAIYSQQKNSDFKNAYNEKCFDNLPELSTKVGNFVVYVKGYIDRIDISGNMFALIDYKTGADKFTYTDIVSGKKLQLFVYVKAVNSLYNKIPVCTCYLPIKNDFTISTDGINQYKFKGVFSNSLQDLQKLDYNYADKSKSYIGLNFTKEGLPDKRSELYTLSSEDILKLADVAFKMVVSAISEIKNGNISINPLYDGASACSRCRYHGICNFDTLYQNKYRFVEKVSTPQQILSNGKNE